MGFICHYKHNERKCTTILYSCTVWGCGCFWRRGGGHFVNTCHKGCSLFYFPSVKKCCSDNYAESSYHYQCAGHLYRGWEGEGVKWCAAETTCASHTHTRTRTHSRSPLCRRLNVSIIVGSAPSPQPTPPHPLTITSLLLSPVIYVYCLPCYLS